MVVFREVPCWVIWVSSVLLAVLLIGSSLLAIHFWSTWQSQSIDLFSNNTWPENNSTMSVKKEIEEKQQGMVINNGNQVTTNAVPLAISHGEEGSQSMNRVNEVRATESDVSLNKTQVPSLLKRERSLDVKVKVNTMKESFRPINNGTLRSLQDQANGLNQTKTPTLTLPNSPDSNNSDRTLGIQKLDENLGNVMFTEKAIEPKTIPIKPKANGDPANIDEPKMKPKDTGLILQKKPWQISTVNKKN